MRFNTTNIKTYWNGIHVMVSGSGEVTQLNLNHLVSVWNDNLYQEYKRYSEIIPIDSHSLLNSLKDDLKVYLDTKVTGKFEFYGIKLTDMGSVDSSWEMLHFYDVQYLVKKDGLEYIQEPFIYRIKYKCGLHVVQLGDGLGTIISAQTQKYEMNNQEFMFEAPVIIEASTTEKELEYELPILTYSQFLASNKVSEMLGEFTRDSSFNELKLTALQYMQSLTGGCSYIEVEYVDSATLDEQERSRKFWNCRLMIVDSKKGTEYSINTNLMTDKDTFDFMIPITQTEPNLQYEERTDKRYKGVLAFTGDISYYDIYKEKKSFESESFFFPNLKNSAGETIDWGKRQADIEAAQEAERKRLEMIDKIRKDAEAKGLNFNLITAENIAVLMSKWRQYYNDMNTQYGMGYTPEQIEAMALQSATAEVTKEYEKEYERRKQESEAKTNIVKNNEASTTIKNQEKDEQKEEIDKRNKIISDILTETIAEIDNSRKWLASTLGISSDCIKIDNGSTLKDMNNLTLYFNVDVREMAMRVLIGGHQISDLYYIDDTAQMNPAMSKFPVGTFPTFDEIINNASYRKCDLRVLEPSGYTVKSYNYKDKIDYFKIDATKYINKIFTAIKDQKMENLAPYNIGNLYNEYTQKHYALLEQQELKFQSNKGYERINSQYLESESVNNGKAIMQGTINKPNTGKVEFTRPESTQEHSSYNETIIGIANNYLDYLQKMGMAADKYKLINTPPTSDIILNPPTEGNP